MLDIKADHSLDCSGHLCPVPILMTEEKMGSVAEGQVLEVVFTDPGAKPDLEMWCRATRHAFLGHHADKLKHYAYIRK